MAQQIQLRRDTTANWTSVNPILAEGEIGLDLTLDKFKIGDGINHWNDLPFTSSSDSSALKIANNLSDLANAATARTNLGLGSAATQNTSAFEAAGAITAHVADSDPHTQYLKESDNILVTPQIIKVKLSNAGTGEHTSLTDAISNITDADPVTKPYVIEMGAGVHTINNPAILPAGVSLRGESINGTELVPQNANQHLLVLNNMCEVSFLNLKGIAGSIGSGKAAIYAEDAGDFTQLHKISIYGFDIGIQNYANTTSSTLYSEYCDVNGDFTFAVKNVSNSSNAARLQVENFYTYPSTATNAVHCYSTGLGAELIINSAGLIGGANNVGISLDNGGVFLASDITVRNFSGTGKGLYNANTGSGSDIDIGGAQFLDNTTDLSIQNPSSTTSITATATPSKISIATGVLVAAQITDASYGGIVTIGEVSQGKSFGKLTPISTLITKTGTTGAYTGGVVSAGSGLSVNVTAGEGFCYDSTNDYIAKVTWGATTLSGLSANTTYYICVDSAGTVQAQTSNPGLVNKIYLARIRTTASSVLWTGSAIMESLHHGNAMETFARNMGAIYISGSIVTENGTRGLDISSGRYQYGTVIMNPSGGTAVSFTTVREDGSGGHIYTSGQTQIDNTYYDNGTGTLATLPNNHYRKDSLYTSGQGANEKLFLVIGQTSYASLVDAEAGTIPTPPDWFSGTICLVASIIQKQGATNIQEIRSERPTLSFQASGVSAASVHANLTGLSADDHPQYLLTNGGRALTGNLNLNSNNITNIGTANGVTIEAHASRHLPNGADPLATGVPSSVSSANSEGVANAFARQDHVHAHGNIGGGSTHSAATSSVNGFMSSTDKAKLDLVTSTELGYVAGVTSAIQTQIDSKAPTASPTFTGTVSGITKSMVGLGNVDNTSDANKPVSTAQQTALDLKANLASPTFTGTVSGITKSMVGLGNVDNTSDVNKPISTATQAYVDAKSVKTAVRFSSIGVNISISSAPATFEGVSAVSGDRILLKDQTTASQNGIYVWNGAGVAMTRATDADSVADLTDAEVYVREGSTAGSRWTQTGTIVTLDTTAISFIPTPIGYHQQTLDTLLQSGATTGQAAVWDGSAWTPTTITATPGGSDTQVQYNNAGSLGGASNVHIHNGDIALVSNASPVAPPAGEVKLFGKTVANRIMPAFVGPTGLEATLQPFLARNKIAYWNPAGNGTGTPGVFGLTAPSTAGTATARNVATTNVLTRMRRLAYVSAAAAGSLASHYIANAQFTTGTGAGLGGFTFVVRFGVSDAGTVSGARHFVGLSSTVAAPTNVEPNTLTNSIGMAQLSTDATQWYLVYGGSAAQTAIALGTGLGAPTLTNTAWELALFSSPNDNAIVYYQVTNLGSGVVATGTLSGTPGTTTPANTTLLTYRQFRTNNATGSAVAFDICSIYIETDN